MIMADQSFTDEQTSRETISAPRQSRRLSDKILIAFHHACDQSDLEIAEALLQTIEVILTRRPVQPGLGRRRDMETLVAAHERLWLLRYPAPEN